MNQMMKLSPNQAQQLQDWRDNINNLSTLTAQIIDLMNYNQEERMKEIISDRIRVWSDMVKISTSFHAPVRDQIIRSKTYAMAWMHASGNSGNQEVENETLHHPLFDLEVSYLQEHLTEEQCREEHSSVAGDTDLNMYLDALTCYFCNRLLNLADGGSRDLYGEDHWSYQRLMALTPKLEDRKMWDEFYVSRSAVVNAFAVFARVWLREPEEVDAWLEKASQMVMETYNAPVAHP